MRWNRHANSLNFRYTLGGSWEKYIRKANRNGAMMLLKLDEEEILKSWFLAKIVYKKINKLLFQLKYKLLFSFKSLKFHGIKDIKFLVQSINMLCENNENINASHEGYKRHKIKAI